MTQLVRAGLIQMAQPEGAQDMTPTAIRDKMIEAHLKLIDEAGAKGVQVLCMQELFYGPYFCPSQDTKWYSITEAVPDGPTTKLMQEYAKKRNMVIVVPLYEQEIRGVYY
ncbi:MAG: nitrilase-related carbon-nitrogen hydrolase, partial [Rudaea sp.]